MERLDEWGEQADVIEHDIPPLQPDQPADDPGRCAGQRRRDQATPPARSAAGFGEGVRGEQIQLGNPLGTTTPDVIYRADDDGPDEGACIYLDGLSDHLHGNPQTAEKDREIRTWLRNRGYEVIEIAVNELDDFDAMSRHFQRLAVYLGRRDLRRKVRQDQSWFKQ